MLELNGYADFNEAEKSQMMGFNLDDESKNKLNPDADQVALQSEMDDGK